MAEKKIANKGKEEGKKQNKTMRNTTLGRRRQGFINNFRLDL